MIETLYPKFRPWSEKGAIFLISDLHFNEDEDLRQAYPNRPEADEMIKIINKTCGKASTILLLGDCGDPEYIKKIRGYKVVIAGNHEHCASDFEEVVDEFYTGPLIIAEKILLSHEPINIPGLYNLHGHVHSGPQFKRGSMNVCADIIKYTPVNFNQFIKSGRLKEIETIHRSTINKQTQRARKRKQK